MKNIFATITDRELEPTIQFRFLGISISLACQIIAMQEMVVWCTAVVHFSALFVI